MEFDDLFAQREAETMATDSLHAVMERLPLVRFADSTYAGRLIMQHLRRLRIAPRRVSSRSGRSTQLRRLARLT